MIARTWHGTVNVEIADAYLDYLELTGVPDLRSTDGNLGVYVLRRTEGELAHFVMISLWKSRESIHAFAGKDIERARYYPEDAMFPKELEPTVTHYDVLAGPHSLE